GQAEGLRVVPQRAGPRERSEQISRILESRLGRARRGQVVETVARAPHALDGNSKGVWRQVAGNARRKHRVRSLTRFHDLPDRSDLRTRFDLLDPIDRL